MFKSKNKISPEYILNMNDPIHARIYENILLMKKKSIKESKKKNKKVKPAKN
tara:strand:+ start:451 stop:606 length:156 start_codon:yes stop_codon:yes gene_type:complete